MKKKLLSLTLVMLGLVLIGRIPFQVSAEYGKRPASLRITGQTSYGSPDGLLWLEVWKKDKIVYQGWLTIRKGNSRSPANYYEGRFFISEPGFYTLKVSMEMGCEAEGDLEIKKSDLGKIVKVRGPCLCPCENLQPLPGYFPYPPDKLRNR